MKKLIILTFAWVLLSSNKAPIIPDVTCYQNGFWDEATTWNSPTAIANNTIIMPDGTKNVEIPSGKVVTLRSNVICKNLICAGTSSFSGNYKIEILGGN